MPVTLNVGYSRKIGEPNYGSRGASVNLQIEREAALAGDAHAVKDQIEQTVQRWQGRRSTPNSHDLVNGSLRRTSPCRPPTDMRNRLPSRPVSCGRFAYWLSGTTSICRLCCNGREDPGNWTS